MADLATQLHDDPEKYINDPNVEFAWAMKAAERAGVHMNILLSVDTNKLKLTKDQTEVYDKFRELFPKLNVEKVSDQELKGDNKAIWAEFCECFNFIEDYNLGTIMRIDASGVYNSENTLIVPKIIFLAIEGARNIEGINEKFKSQYLEEYKKTQDGSGQLMLIFSGCKRQYQNQLRSSCFYLHLINGVILAPVDHDCPPRDTDIVLQYQKFLEEGNGPLARRMTSLVNFDFGETSLANIVNKLNLPSSSLQRSSTLTGKGNENINVEKTLANLKRKLIVTDYTSSSADKPCTAKKSKEIEVGDKIHISINHKNTVKMMEKETTPIRITTFLFEKPSVSALKNICNKLDIKYCKEAMNFWKEIKFIHIDTVSTNIQTQKFKTKNFYKILSNFFTGKFCDYDQIYYAINMAFGEKLLADDQLSYEEIDLLCSSFTVTEKHFKFIAKFIPCRILIFDSDSDKKEPRKFGKWKNDCRNILTLVLSFSNRKYSVVLNL
uniref:Polysaccharide biosynthesis domain-containing protein n=1 Tax=Panagrolaimus superbus TaxID=310955 RepID=A0A914XSA9_9BILA